LGCLAGIFSFDIKPTGFWICQDQPSNPLLNILDPDFLEKHRRLISAIEKNAAVARIPATSLLKSSSTHVIADLAGSGGQ